MTVIITDSTSDVGLEWAEKNKVELIAQEVLFGTESYFDQIDMTSEGFYIKMRESKDHPTTALVTAGRFSKLFEKYSNEEILVVSLAHEFSGTGDSAQLAIQMSGRQDIVFVDTRTVAAGTGLLLDVAVELRDQGKSAGEIADALNGMKDKIKIIAALATMKNLVKGGRISPAKAAIGAALSVKPIIAVADGTIDAAGKERGMKKATATVAEMVKKDIDTTRPVKYIHSNNLEGVELLKELVGAEGPTGWLGNAVGVHAGEGAVGIAYFTK